ncbi:FAD-dependent monooxygenase [Amycolatopsis sp. OK19-0408]|uniref:FAD-dependent monooxygenase n=1 Tax=Amycolatopsis iheyensis TaxID=2945988 RepID=A0A9X2SKB3_9PSEU|nr:FAD-dependent monooxygenase [Amycolatopsis iheyensis]MCR6485602.1 FAD-dependent monooxygenase [Amycolatopsis iheyensis]
MTLTDVIVVGAGPTGLMLAAELRLAGVRPLVLERHPRLRETAKAGGLGGQILELLRYRGLLERLEAAVTGPVPPPVFPFGGLHVDLSDLADPPMHALPLPQARLERLLDDRARELGAEIRRGHEVLAVTQDGDSVTVGVRGPDGPYEVTARYVVGCDGPRSRVRELAGIGFPGTSYPEVNRIGQVTVPAGITVRPDGDLEVPGLGTVHAGFTRTDRGVFGFGSVTPGVLMFSTVEEEPVEYDDDVPMDLAEFQASIGRVLGGEFPLGEPRRLSRFTFKARQASSYGAGRVFVAGDAAHLFPATGVALNAGLLDAVNLAWKLAAGVDGWAPPGLLATYHEERHFAGARTMLHTQAQVALRRGLDPAADALREVVGELLTDEVVVRRVGALIAGTDIRYPGGDHPLTGTFAPDLALHTDDGPTSVAELLRRARPVFVDLAGRPDLREVVAEWPRVEVCAAKTDRPPADALLIRPDGYIAWAASESPADALRAALTAWFG